MVVQQDAPATTSEDLPTTTDDLDLAGIDPAEEGWTIRMLGGFVPTADDSESRYSLDRIPLDPEFCELPTSEPPAEPTRIDRTNDAGEVIGYSLVTESPQGNSRYDYDQNDNLVAYHASSDDYQEESIWEEATDDEGYPVGKKHSHRITSGDYSAIGFAIYDFSDNLISSHYSDSNGYQCQSQRLAIPDGLEIGSVALAYILRTSATWADGSSYETKDTYNVDGNLVRSESTNSDGSQSLYQITPQYDDQGELTGYLGSWTWTDADGATSSSAWNDHYDAAFTLLSSKGGEIVYAASDPTVLRSETLTSPSEVETFVTSSDADIHLRASRYDGLANARLHGDLDLDLRGNAQANILEGNDGSNSIYGGRSKDILTGGDDVDYFIFKPIRRSCDTVTDFNPNEDRIALTGGAFDSLFEQGRLRQAVLGKSLIFNDETKRLQYVYPGDNGRERTINLVELPDFSAAELHRDLFVQA